ncbi:MAG: type II and III secretion system protein [Burkholderiales bacterium]|nr:type II and III secretion system protein [Burkholderiales bacterium]
MEEAAGSRRQREGRGHCAIAIVLLAAGCAQAPLKPADTHLRAPEPRAEGEIPPPVLVAPVLPVPKPAPRPETYSVVVNDVPVHDLLFALARDAKLNVDIHPGLTGRVTLNAIDQTLPQLLARIARQVDMRWELDGQNLVVMRDTPYLRVYKVDYVSASRNVKMQSTASTQFGTTGATSPGAAVGTAAGTGATATVDVVSTNQLWDAIVQNVREILRETDKIVPLTAPAPAAQPATAAAPPAAPAPAQSAQAPPAAPAPAAQPAVEFREAASVIGNRESGVLFVRATSRQHEKVQEFLDQVLANIRRQVLIEATIVEVQLNNAYQRGIDWSRVRRGASGVTLRGFSAPAIPEVDTNRFIIDAAVASIGLEATIRMLETFGDVRVLSSPKVSVLNNQIALLRVTRDIVYFTVSPSTTPITIAATAGVPNIQLPFNTTPQVAAEGFMMSVLPQVSDNDTIVLNVRPTIRRRVDFAVDPNPAIPAATPNLVPVFETRELDSILRIQSGQIAVLGGLMQEQAENTEDAIPGVRDLPLIGPLTGQRRDVRRKTELVIFLRATVLRDPTIGGDFRELRQHLPGEDFFRKPNPGRVAPQIGPSGAPLQ